MLAYFGFQATTTDAIADSIKEASEKYVSKDADVILRRRLKILNVLSLTNPLVLSKVYTASGAIYSDMKLIVDELEKEGMMSMKKNLKTRSISCLLTVKGAEYVKQYSAGSKEG